jgi:hypothetical protein
VSEVVGLFDDAITADNATERLETLGFDAEHVGLASRPTGQIGEVTVDNGMDRDRTMGEEREGTIGEEAAKGAGGGAIGGAAVGAGAGLLASAGMLVVPGIGPFLAAGTLAGTLGAAAAGAAGGAAIGGAAGAIFGASDNEEEVDLTDDTSVYYREGFAEGQAIVTVDVSDGREEEVALILRDAGAEKVDVYGDTGWIS